MSKTPIAEMNKYFVSHRNEAEKAAAARLLIQKIGEHTDIKDMKEYDGYTGKKFLLYMFK